MRKMRRKSFGNALIIGRQDQQMREVAGILTPYYQKVFHRPSSVDAPEEAPDHSFSLVVMTDLSQVPRDREAAVRLRERFPQAKLIGILDCFDLHVEVALRSIGVVFLGSFDRFQGMRKTILAAALKSFGG
jgi:hypothetical protein